MNILQLVSAANLNGAMRHCYDLSCELAARGHRVLLGHKAGAWIAQQPMPDGVELIEMTFKRRLAELRRVAVVMKERHIDVIHTHSSSAHMFGALLSLLYHYPRVATSHNTFLQPHWWYCDRIIAPSKATARFQRWVNWVPRRCIDIIPNFINTTRLQAARTRNEVRRELGVEDDTFVIITVGEVFRRKNQELLVRALPSLISSGVKPLVLLIGKQDPAYRQLLDSCIQRLNVESHVRLMGQRSDIPDLLAASDIFCLPSRSEVMPIALLESMATGLPCVATNVGGVAELVRHNIDGLITKPGDLTALSNALLKIDRDPSLRATLGRAAQENVKASYSPEVCVPKIVECFEKCLSR
ncbi:MAG TPA: glycosyltransferase family 4 protein [Verrucomicrobiales bacterium]|nr:glycosyltransferase family 4 protein [Verrucomicrobiales bacterium]